MKILQIALSYFAGGDTYAGTTPDSDCDYPYKYISPNVILLGIDMITTENLLSYKKSNLIDMESLQPSDINQLVKWLGEKNDNIRYNSFLLLQHRSETHSDVYQYWDVFLDKLDSVNSYQRSIGIMLMAENAKWDKDNKFEKAIDLYLSFCNDEKPITVRQCIQSLCKIVPYKTHLCMKIAEKLMSIEVMKRKETQRKILLLDILNTLIEIRKQVPSNKIDMYIANAMADKILDKKAKSKITAHFPQMSSEK